MDRVTEICEMPGNNNSKMREEWTVCWKCGETEKKVRLGLLECGHVLCSQCVSDETPNGLGFRCPIPSCSTSSKWHDLRGSNFAPEIRDLLVDDDTALEHFEEGVGMMLERLKRQVVFASRHRIARQKQSEKKLEAWKRYRDKVTAQLEAMKQHNAALHKKCAALNASRTKIIAAYKAQGAALQKERESSRQLRGLVEKLTSKNYRSREVITPSSYQHPNNGVMMKTPSSIRSVSSLGHENLPPTPPDGLTPRLRAGYESYDGGNRNKPNNSYNRKNPQFGGRDDRIRKPPVVVHHWRGNEQSGNSTRSLN